MTEHDDLRTPFPEGMSQGGAIVSLPPEVMLAASGPGKQLDYAKSDIFGFGMVLYHMLSGDNNRKPFGTDNHIEFTAASYIDLPECYEEDVREFVRALLMPDPAQRLSVEEAKERVRQLDAACLLF